MFNSNFADINASSAEKKKKKKKKKQLQDNCSSSDNEKIPHFDELPELCQGQDSYKTALASELITHSVKTPFDSANWVQVLQNPNEPGSFIVVQRVKRNTKSFDDFQGQKIDMRQAEKNALKYFYKDHFHQLEKQVQEGKCKTCLKKSDHQNQHQCDECNQFVLCDDIWSCKPEINKVVHICVSCITQIYVENKIDAKTVQQQAYKELEADFQNDQFILKPSEKLLPSNCEELTVVSFWFPTVLGNDEYSQNIDKTMPSYTCRYQYNLYDGVFIKTIKTGQNDKFEVEELFFNSTDGENIYYFTKRNEHDGEKLDLWRLKPEKSTHERNLKKLPSQFIHQCQASLKQNLLYTLGLLKNKPIQLQWPEIDYEKILVKGVRQNSNQNEHEQQDKFDLFVFMLGQNEPFLQKLEYNIFLDFCKVEESQNFEIWTLNRNLSRFLIYKDTYDSKGQHVVKESKNWVIKYNENQIMKATQRTKEQADDHFTLNFKNIVEKGLPECLVRKNGNDEVEIVTLFNCSEKTPNLFVFNLNQSDINGVQVTPEAEQLNPNFVKRIKNKQMNRLLVFHQLRTYKDKENQAYITVKGVVQDLGDKQVYSKQRAQPIVFNVNKKQYFEFVDETHRTPLNWYCNPSLDLCKIGSIFLSNGQIEGFKLAIIGKELTNKLSLTFTLVQKDLDFTHQVPFFVTENQFTINYPILAYQGFEPMQNRIVLANLAHDQPQVSIKFSNEFKIVRFFENSSHNPIFFQNFNLKQIICLIYNPKLKYNQIISISLDCWKNKNIQIQTISSTFEPKRMLEYKINKTSLINRTQLQKETEFDESSCWLGIDKILKARHQQLQQIMFYNASFTQKQGYFLKGFIQHISNNLKDNYDVDYKKKIYQQLGKPCSDFILFLFSAQITQIYAFDFSANKFFEVREQLNNEIQILPLKIAAGHNQDAFFACQHRIKKNYQVMRIFRNQSTKELDFEKVFETDNKILALQTENNIITKRELQNSDFKLLVLDFGFQMHQIFQDDETNQWKQMTLKFDENDTIFNLFSKLASCMFQGIVLEKSSIQAPNYLLNNDQEKNSSSINQINLDSLNCFSSMPKLQFNLPSSISEKNVFKYEQISCICRDVMQCENTNKQSYFLTFKKNNSRQIDLMNSLDSRFFIKQLYFTEERIFCLVNHEQTESNSFITSKRCIEFDRRTFLIVNIHSKVSKIQLSQASQDNPQFAVLQDENKEECRKLLCIRQCKQCRPISKASNPFNLKDSIKKLKSEFCDTILSTKVNCKVHWDYIITETGEFVFLVVVREQDQVDNNEIRIKKFELNHNGEVAPPFKYIYQLNGSVFKLNSQDQQKIGKVKNYFYMSQTNNFVVLRVQNRIIYYNKNELTHWDNEKTSSQQVQSSDSLFGLPSRYKVKFEEIDLSQLVIKDEVMHIRQINQEELQFYNYQSPDLIQLNFDNKIICWDLKANQQLNQLENFQNLFNPETFVDTGFTLFKYVSTYENRVKKTKMIELIQSTQHNMYCLKYNQLQNEMGYIFCSYSFSNIIEILQLKDEDKDSDLRVSLSTLTSEIFGKSIFEAIYQNPVPLNSIHYFNDMAQEGNFMNEEQKNMIRRALVYLLTRPTTKGFTLLEDEQDLKTFKKTKEMHPSYRRSIIQHLIIFLNISTDNKINDQKTRQLETFIDIVTSHDNLELQQIICCVQEFMQFYCNMRELEATKLFISKWKINKNHHFQQSIALQWNKSSKLVIFGARSNLIDESVIRKRIQEKQRSQIEKLYDYQRIKKFPNWFKRIVKKIKESNFFKPDQSMVTVDIRVYKINWLWGEEDLLYDVLSSQSELSVFSDRFVIDILNWQNLTQQLFPIGLVPYLTFSLSTLFFYIQRLGKGKSDEKVIRIISFISMAWLLFLECFQLKKNGLFYFFDRWNIFMLTSYVMTIYVFYLESQKMYQPPYGERIAIISSLNGFLILQGLFYWSQMFDKISMYWRIILDSVADSKYFMYMVALILANFGISVYILDQTQQMLSKKEKEFSTANPAYFDSENPDGYKEFTLDKTNNEVLDNLVTQYLLMLGEFEIIGNKALFTYPYHSQLLLWIYFFAATFISQVIFLNVLVNVIGESYGSRWAMRDEFALQQKTKIFADYCSVMKTSLPRQYPYLYVVQPKSEEEEPSVEDTVDTIKGEIGDKLEQMETRLRNEMKEQFEQLAEIMREKKEKEN